MKTFLLGISLTLCLSFISNKSVSQCVVEATAEPDSVCPGDHVALSMIYSCSGTLSDNFNNGLFQSFLIPTSGASFSNLCNPTSDSSIYLWMGSDVTIPRILTTITLDATEFNEVSFDMKLATQGYSTPCEGPDEFDEGITLQYTINGGLTWVNIIYFQPDGVMLSANPMSNALCITPPYITPFTSWANYSFPIPTAAKTTTTQFRWIQEQYSSPVNDHWGLDNIVFSTQVEASISWSNGDTTETPYWVYPVTDTSFTVEVTSLQTGISVSDTVYVKVFKPSVYISGGDLWADTTYQTYFWIDCSTGQTILGSNGQSFTPQANGSYALYATTSTGCSAQSDCINFNSLGLNSFSNATMSIFPVPTHDEVIISNNAGIETEYFLLDFSGKLLTHFSSDSPEVKLGLSAFYPGIYLLKASNNNTVQTFRIEKL